MLCSLRSFTICLKVIKLCMLMLTSKYGQVKIATVAININIYTFNICLSLSDVIPHSEDDGKQDNEDKDEEYENS